MKNRIIGIDPDIDKSGVCCLYASEKKVELMSFRFPALLEYLSEQEGKEDLVVVVEAGWKTEMNNYHKEFYYGHVPHRIAKDVGRNQQVGHCIVEMCQHWGIPVIEKAPLRKMWKGRDRKITHEELSAFVSGLPSRTNPETRDACLLAWDYAGFPIRIAPIPHKTRRP